MSVKYYCPRNLKDAIALLNLHDKKTILLGGGTHLCNCIVENSVLIDLSKLQINKIEISKNFLFIGGMATLSNLELSPLIPETMKKAIKFEATHNIRNQATIAGTILSGNGRSLISSFLLAIDAYLLWFPGKLWVPFRKWQENKSDWDTGYILRSVKFPMIPFSDLETIGRTPSDIPIVHALLCKWQNGRVRIVIGGHGEIPALITDGELNSSVIELAKISQLDNCDDWASSEYRSEIAGVLTTRLIRKLPA